MCSRERITTFLCIDELLQLHIKYISFSLPVQLQMIKIRIKKWRSQVVKLVLFSFVFMQGSVNATHIIFKRQRAILVFYKVSHLAEIHAYLRIQSADKQMKDRQTNKGQHSFRKGKDKSSFFLSHEYHIVFTLIFFTLLKVNGCHIITYSSAKIR